MRKDVAIVVDYDFHKKRGWHCFGTYHLFEAVRNAFDATWITSQAEYDCIKHQISHVFTGEYGCPRLKYDTSLNHTISMLFSDPHDNKRKWFPQYMLDNKINHVLAYYDEPTRRHYPDLPVDKIVHFPWAVPDEYADLLLRYNSRRKIALTGSMGSAAYRDRVWCSKFAFVSSRGNGSCGGGNYFDELSYHKWLNSEDAVIAADSDDYCMVTPKYFEIANSGALLIAQYCPDLHKLGFRNNENCIIFNRATFEAQCRDYLENKDTYSGVRRAGQKLVRQSHLISHRIEQLMKLWGVT